MEWYLAALKKYAVFAGRARRKEYWMFFLFNILIGLCLGVLSFFFEGLSFLGLLYTLAVLLPGVAVTVRRLHDVGHSGWWIFINLVPVAGAIVTLVFLVQDGEEGYNAYGPNPKTS